jgi:hypothetical protein
VLCPDLPGGSIIALRDGEKPAVWYRDEPDAARVVDASWDATGTRPWALVEEPVDPRTLVLGMVTDSDTFREVAKRAINLSIASPSLSGIAGDDSIVTVSLPEPSSEGDAQEAGRRTAVIDTRTGRTMDHRGEVAAILPSSIVDGWPGGAYGVAVDERGGKVEPGDEGAAFVLPSRQTQVDDYGRVLLEHEQPATTSALGEPSTVVLGPIVRGHDVADTRISVVCHGLSDLTVATVPPSGDPVTNRCLGASESYLLAPGEPGDEFSIAVTTDAATAWRAMVFEYTDG